MRWLFALLLTTGCPTITTADLDERGLDADADGHGVPKYGGDDCDDHDASAHPGAPEIPYDARDQDCNGIDLTDVDGDGIDSTEAAGTDCDDAAPDVRPGVPEICNGIDDDCDGALLAEGEADVDGDGYAGCAGGDCDDTDASRHPGTTERCDDADVDEDCDGASDDADDGVIGGTVWYYDGDGDGYGNGDAPRTQCDPASSAWIAVAGDCDDANPRTNPGGPELCAPAGVDENCDGIADDADPDVTGQPAWYPDDDGDGFGRTAAAVFACLPPGGHVALGGDCDDADPEANPGETETCDAANTDEDCDSLADDTSASGQNVWFRDVDSDGFGDDVSGRTGCDAPSGWVVVGGDCAVGDAAIHPDGREICGNGTDDDCDALAGCFGDELLAERATALWGGTGGRAGTAVAGVGDVDGDGFDDVLVGSTDDGGGYIWSEGGPGAASLVLGSSAPVSSSLAAADATFAGERPSHYAAGCAVAGAGDVNGDGYDDMLVGADGFELTHGIAVRGHAYLILGSSAPISMSLADADAKLSGVGEADLAGYSVAGAGDVDADGYDDMLVGAPGHEAGCAPQVGGWPCGAVYLVLGSVSQSSISLTSADAAWLGDTAFDAAGRAVAGAGDVDADGHADILVGTASGSGYLILGSNAPVSSSLSAADARYTDPTGTGNISVAGSGDVDADGYADVLVGTGAAAYLVLGSNAPTSLSLASADATFAGLGAGSAVDGAGDVDADGFDDMLIGAEAANAAYLVLGSSPPASVSLTDAVAVFRGQTPSRIVHGFDDDAAGAAVAGVGDVDADGYADLLVGANNQDDGGELAGAAYLILQLGSL